MTELGHMENPIDSISKFLKYHQSKLGKDMHEVSVNGPRTEKYSLLGASYRRISSFSIHVLYVKIHISRAENPLTVATAHSLGRTATDFPLLLDSMQYGLPFLQRKVKVVLPVEYKIDGQAKTKGVCDSLEYSIAEF